MSQTTRHDGERIPATVGAVARHHRSDWAYLWRQWQLVQGLTGVRNYVGAWRAACDQHWRAPATGGPPERPAWA